MRGIETPVREIRRRVFKEIAKFAYEQKILVRLRICHMRLFLERLRGIATAFTGRGRL